MVGVLTMSGVLVLLTAITVPAPGLGAEVFTWTDENGTIHFSDSASDVPGRYRTSTKQKKFGPDEDPSPASSPAPEPPTPDITVSPETSTDSAQTPQRFEVPYVPYEGTARRVIVSVRFNDRVTAPMILDTGAPGTLISTKIAEELGLLDRDHGRLLVRIGGIGGNTVAVRTVLDRVQIGDAKVDFVPAEITESVSERFEGLVGMDFMGNYSTQIDAQKHVVVFEQIDDGAPRPGGHDELWWRNTFQEFAASYNAWKSDLQRVDHEIEGSSLANRSMPTDLSMRRDLAKWQSNEAEKLMDRLHRFAREHAVPMHWRTY